MDKARFEQYCNLTIQLLNASDDKVLTTVLRENCLLIDAGLVGVMKMVEQQLIEEGNIKAAAWLQNFYQQLEEALNNWKQLNQTALKLYSQGNYAEALDCAQRALDLARIIWLNDDPNVATSLNNLGVLLKEQGKLAEAEPYIREALAMRQRLYKGDHPHVAISLDNLGRLLLTQGQLAEAEPYVREASRMFQRLYQGDHLDVAISLNNLGLLLQVQGKLSEAQDYLYRALTMRQRLFKGDHPHIATSLDQLGLLLQAQGKLSEAQDYFHQALTMRQRLYQGDHSYVALSFNNLGYLLQAQGKLTEAEPYVRDAWAMVQRLYKGDHLDVAFSLNNLGFLLQAQGKLSEAQDYFHQALTMLQRLFEGDHFNVANSLNNQGYLLQAQGKLSEAQDYFHQALAMRQRLFKGDHPDVAGSLNNLGFLLQAQGKLNEAGSYYRNALEMFQRLFEDNHPNVANSLNNLGLLLVQTDRYQEALEKFQEAVAVEQKITSRVFAFSSEADRLYHLQTIRTTTNALLSLVVTYLRDNPEAVRVACDVVLQRKGLSAAAVAAFNAAIYDKRYQHLTEKLEQWRSLNEQIIYWTFKQDTLQEREHLRQLKQKADNLEKYLASQVPEIQLQDQTVNRQTVAQRLPAGSVLLEFVCFDLYDFVNNQWISSRYLVFILPARQPDKVVMEVLEEAAEIEQLIARVQSQAITYTDANGKLVRLGVDFDAIFEDVSPSLANPAIQLCQAIFDPIRQYLADSRQIVISPDASLSLVPFQILPFDESGGELLMDYYSINYISAARDLFRSQVQHDSSSSLTPSSLIIGDPQFWLGEIEAGEIQPREPNRFSFPVRESATQVAQKIQQMDSPNPDKESDSEGEKRLARVEATGILAQKVADLLGVEPHLQKDALTTYLTDYPCPNILLIGTHGLYSAEAEAPPPLPLQISSGDRFSKISQAPNPMLRSGLAFAGADNWLQGHTLPAKVGKGFLFAQDIALLDLWANELTVLCACQSAVGEISIGEGVFGLRRAFAVAGAKTLVMSLWSVPTRASTLLMERFFHNLHNCLRYDEALQEAQNYIRTITIGELKQLELGRAVLAELEKLRLLSQNDSYKPLAHPFFWGAWICQGQT